MGRGKIVGQGRMQPELDITSRFVQGFPRREKSPRAKEKKEID